MGKSFSTCQGWVFSNNWGEEVGEREKIGSISKGNRSFSTTYLVLKPADCFQDARTLFNNKKLRLLDSLLISLFDGVGGVGHGGHAKLKVQGAPLQVLRHLLHATVLHHQPIQLEQVQILVTECRLAGEGST